MSYPVTWRLDGFEPFKHEVCEGRPAGVYLTPCLCMYHVAALYQIFCVFLRTSKMFFSEYFEGYLDHCIVFRAYFEGLQITGRACCVICVHLLHFFGWKWARKLTGFACRTGDIHSGQPANVKRLHPSKSPLVWMFWTVKIHDFSMRTRLHHMVVYTQKQKIWEDLSEWAVKGKKGTQVLILTVYAKIECASTASDDESLTGDGMAYSYLDIHVDPVPFSFPELMCRWCPLL